MAKKTYDLENRLLEYVTVIIRLVEHMTKTRSGNHVAAQLIRSGTAPLPNHAEAQAAESPRDFIHKMRICLKELRESKRWHQLIKRIPLLKAEDEVDWALAETEELIRIFVASIRTAEKGNPQRRFRST